MLEAAINKIISLADPHVEMYNGFFYTDKVMHRIDDEVYADPLQVHTLSAIIDYIANGTDDDVSDINRRFVIHIRDYNRVVLTRELSTDRKREQLLCATDDTQQFPYGRYLDVESFVIAMQTYFLQDDTTALLVRLVSSVTDNKSVQQTDDGLSQTVTAKTGILTCNTVEIPNPVHLHPLCTFPEAIQPERRFVFRLRGGESGVQAALFEADGNAWKKAAINNVSAWLSNELPEKMRDDVIILA